MPASQPSKDNAVDAAETTSGLPLIVRFLAVLLLVAMGSGISVGYVAWDTAGEALEAATREQLTTARAIKGTLIGNYFRNVEDEVSVLAMLPETAEAIETFEVIFKKLDGADASVAEEKMRDFISDVFMAKYEFETGDRLPASAVMSDRPASLAVQAAYLADNPNPLGSKDLLESSGSLPDYDQAHERFHSIFRNLLKTFGYYDIFLVDRTGEIVYSVYKETDFGTNLLTGPFKDSGLADAVRASLEARSSNAYAFADFSTYIPSYDAPAAFVSRPVYAGETLVGVVAVQLPIDEIDEVMTGGRRWADEGFGTTGEAYLVGPDRLMRSDARALIEDPEAFIRDGRERGVPIDTLREMERLGRTVLLERVENDAVILALEGQSGNLEVLSYDGSPSVASFESIAVFDQIWALIAEVDRSEAYAAADAMRSRIITTAVIVLVFVVVVSIIFGQRLTAPIGRLHAAMVRLQAGDFSVTVPPGGGRELTSLALAYNRVAASLGLKTRMESANDRKDELIDEIAGMTATQASSSIQIMGAVAEISAGSREIAKTSEELTGTMSEVDGIASENAIRSTSGLESLHRIETVMTEVVGDAKNVSDHLGEIERRCEAMGQVVTTMVSIADRTQILSINATMEAEKAGDAGLGFRVVAREVRRLADRTAESAAQIEENVKRMLASVDDGVRNMNVFQSRLDETAATNAQIAEGLTEVIGRNQELNPRFATVLESMKAQRDAARQISEAMSELSDNVGTTSDAVKQVDESIADLREMASRLKQEIADEEQRLGLD
ncbi:MAG: methyl-accepting chemotaxis protein [Phycisphaerales bacterium]|nr:methyl-accepting chemotaxis protein [Phycisphaerales bacterium]